MSDPWCRFGGTPELLLHTPGLHDDMQPGVCGSGSCMMAVWCVDVVLLYSAHTHMQGHNSVSSLRSSLKSGCSRPH